MTQQGAQGAGPGVISLVVSGPQSRVVDSAGSFHPSYLGVHRFCPFLAAIVTVLAIASLPLFAFLPKQQ